MFGDSLTVADTLLISGFSILSVFLVLLLLSYMIVFCAFLVKRSETLPETGTGTAAPAANDSSDVLLAAAAVAACLSVEPDDIVVRRIRRVEDCGGTWAQSARLESIR